MKSLLTLFLFLSPALVFAAPTTGPAGETAGGLFATYFSNIASTPCATNSIVTSFSSSSDTNYLKTNCTNIGTLLGSFFSTYGTAPSGQAVVGWNSITGAPLYASIASAWNSITGGIAYIGGSVGIGTDDPGYKLDVDGDVGVSGWIRNRGAAGWYNDTNGVGFATAPGVINVYGTARIGNVQSPTAANDVATKSYVDAAVSAGGGGAMKLYTPGGVAIGYFLSYNDYIVDTVTTYQGDTTTYTWRYVDFDGNLTQTVAVYRNLYAMGWAPYWEGAGGLCGNSPPGCKVKP